LASPLNPPTTGCLLFFIVRPCVRAWPTVYNSDRLFVLDGANLAKLRVVSTTPADAGTGLRVRINVTVPARSSRILFSISRAAPDPTSMDDLLNLATVSTRSRHQSLWVHGRRGGAGHLCAPRGHLAFVPWTRTTRNCFLITVPLLQTGPSRSSRSPASFSCSVAVNRTLAYLGRRRSPRAGLLLTTWPPGKLKWKVSAPERRPRPSSTPSTEAFAVAGPFPACMV